MEQALAKVMTQPGLSDLNVQTMSQSNINPTPVLQHSEANTNMVMHRQRDSGMINISDALSSNIESAKYLQPYSTMKKQSSSVFNRKRPISSQSAANIRRTKAVLN